MLEFAYIAGPFVFHQSVFYRRVHRLVCHAVSVAQFAKKMHSQGENILATIAQRSKLYGKNRQAIIKVLPEGLALATSWTMQVHVCRRHHSHIHLYYFI